MRKLIAVLICGLASTLYAATKAQQESLLKQNRAAKEAGLHYIEDEEDLANRTKSGALVPIKESPEVVIDTRLRSEWQFILPHVVPFILEEPHRFKEACGGSPTQINSAVRTPAGQAEIRKGGNGNAAAVTGDMRSVHLTGSAVDIAKMPLTSRGLRILIPLRERLWWKRELEQLAAQGLIIFDEEIHQAVFHVMVLPKYAGAQLPPSPPCTLFKHKPAK